MLNRILRFFGFRRVFSNSPVFVVPKNVTSIRVYAAGGGGGGSGKTIEVKENEIISQSNDGR